MHFTRSNSTTIQHNYNCFLYLDEKCELGANDTPTFFIPLYSTYTNCVMTMDDDVALDSGAASSMKRSNNQVHHYLSGGMHKPIAALARTWIFCMFALLQQHDK